MPFQEELINWYHQHKRDLPWRNTTDPYVIWLSEVIMQQTRVDQGLPYFNRFLAQFPTVADFASASETHVLKLWQGLGYYSRGRNMLHTAIQVQQQYGSLFPVRYEQLIKLKGIGEYTAAAISSFSANESRAVVDGNVFRVLSRYFGLDTPINSSSGKKEFAALAQNLISGQEPSVYNQAIMEFGALQCKPRNPNCTSCPLQPDCYARRHNMVHVLPVKIKKAEKKIRHFNYFILKSGHQVAVRLRQPGDIWQHLYDFPLIETNLSFDEDPETLLKSVQHQFGTQCHITSISATRHILTHQIIYVRFFAIDNYIVNFNHNTNIKWVSEAELDQLPQPKVITGFINNYLFQ